MAISRRALFRHLGAGAAASVGIPSVARAATIDRALDVLSDAPENRGPVRLHKNESAFGASPRATAAMREAGPAAAHRYPEVTNAALRKKLASLHHVYADHIVLGCGSDDVLGMAIAALGSGRKIVTAFPTYDRLLDRARLVATEVVSVPLRADHSHDLEAMLARVDASTGLVYICNPNNPTGSLTRRQDLDRFIARLPETVHVLIDEAYHYYAGGSSDYASFIDRPLNDRRIVVTRSFSTVYGLAGLRIGYGVAHPEVVARLESSAVSTNLPSVAALAAIAALDDTDHIQAAIKRNADDRQEFCNQANARMLRTVDSHANFVLLNTGHDGVEMVEHFRKHGVLVAGPFQPFDKYIRVSLGATAEMREFWRVWDLLPPNHAMVM
jgi:histidinol-phosphate aminotransferase